MSNLDEANKIGNLFNSWGKIFVGFGTAVASCAFAYWLILETAKDVKINEERGEKRFNRAMEMAKELKEEGIKREEALKQEIRNESEITRQIQIEVAYMKGKYESIKNN